MSKISIIIPVFNEEKNIQPLYVELSSTISKLDNYDFEIIFINDGSTDQSLMELQKIDQQYNNLTGDTIFMVYDITDTDDSFCE